MIVTKKMWLSWKDSEWVLEEPKRHNGILEIGDSIEPDHGFVPFSHSNHEDHAGPDFTIKELFRFIKDGTFILKEEEQNA